MLKRRSQSGHGMYFPYIDRTIFISNVYQFWLSILIFRFWLTFRNGFDLGFPLLIPFSIIIGLHMDFNIDYRKWNQQWKTNDYPSSNTI